MGKFVDMTGWVMKEHGVPDSRVTVIERAEDRISPKGYRTTMYKCLCECGTIFITSAGGLRNGSIKSCGCLQKETARSTKFLDLTGQRFGRLLVLYQANDHITPSGRHRVTWHCLCDCGNEIDVISASLRSGVTQSCGCLCRDQNSKLDESLREYDQQGNIIKRVCQCCKRMLSVDEYYKNSHTADGYSGVCKYCYSHSLQGRYNVYRKGAKARNLDFNLTRDEFDLITSQPCHYCGEYSEKYFDKEYSGVDRVDSSLGYSVDNVVPCCDMCNRMKLDYNIDVWINKMKQILKNLEE
jgi:hypothetical protein